MCVCIYIYICIYMYNIYIYIYKYKYKHIYVFTHICPPLDPFLIRSYSVPLTLFSSAICIIIAFPLNVDGLLVMPLCVFV